MRFTVEGFPDYNLYEWAPGSDGPIKLEETDASSFTRFSVDIPDKYIQFVDANDGTTEKGRLRCLRNMDQCNVDWPATLQYWRTESPVGPRHPRTQDGIGRYPIIVNRDDYTDPSNFPDRNGIRSISLQHMFQRYKDHENLRISAADGTPVQLAGPKTELMKELQRIKDSGGPVDCSKRKDIDAPAVWTTAECMMCNCANESLPTTKDKRDRLWIHQVVLKRMVSSDAGLNRDVFYAHPAYGRSICGMVLGQKRFGNSIGHQFSWTKGRRQKTTRMPMPKANQANQMRILNDCAETAIQALELGPGQFDHYHNNNVCPDWHPGRYLATNAEGKQYWACPNGERVGFHKFLTLHPNLALGNSHLLEEELGSSDAQPVLRPLLDAPTTIEEIINSGE